MSRCAGATTIPSIPSIPSRVVLNALLLLLLEMLRARGSSSSSRGDHMTDAEATALLRLRRELTGESFNDATVGAWREALDLWPAPAVRGALIASARSVKRVAVPDVVERLPTLTVNPAHREEERRRQQPDDGPVATPEQATRALEAGVELGRRQRLHEAEAAAERGDPGAAERLERLAWWQAGAKGPHP